MLSWLFKIPFVRPLVDRFQCGLRETVTSLGAGEHGAVRDADFDYKGG